MFMLVGLSVLLLVAAAGVAVAVDVAANRFCNDLPCIGTENDDQLIEREGNRERDRILGLEGEDLIDANNWTQDRDVLEGGRQDDRLLTNDGDSRDAARGGRGSDRCVADPGDSVSSCRRIAPTSAEGMALSGE
jgi:hypothetical protein